MGNAKKRSGSVASMLPVLLACSFTASFGQSMMNVALPELAERFGVTLSIANWVMRGVHGGRGDGHHAVGVHAEAPRREARVLRRRGGRSALGTRARWLSRSFPMLFASRLV